jgi:hypothetical protein
MAGRRRLEEAAPLLRKLEWASHVGRTSSSLALDLREGEIHPFSYGDYSLRQAAQLSLRRLGERPAGCPATFFRYHSPGGAGRKFVPEERAEPRARGASRIGEQMTPLEVLEILGPPDAVDPSPGAWEYDLSGGKEPYTLRLVWDEQRVSSIERITPPRWAAGDRRDLGLSLLAGGPVTPAQIGASYAPAPAEGWPWPLALAAVIATAVLGAIGIVALRRRRAPR